jgi:hypothetical protein
MQSFREEAVLQNKMVLGQSSHPYRELLVVHVVGELRGHVLVRGRPDGVELHVEQQSRLTGKPLNRPMRAWWNGKHRVLVSVKKRKDNSGKQK